MSASDLPDELWARVLELGAGAASSALGFRDLCAVAIASRRLRRLSLHPSLWSALLSRDFPTQSSQPSTASSSSQQQLHPKSVYKTKFERHKVRMAEARRRVVFEAEGRVLACRRRLTQLEESLQAEGEKMKAAAQELDNLERVRRASVALNVWQPQVVRGRQKQLVQQCTVPVDSRLSDVNMELKVCKQQIATYKNIYNKEKEKLNEYEEALKRAIYHPLQSSHTSSIANEPQAKRKKLKFAQQRQSSPDVFVSTCSLSCFRSEAVGLVGGGDCWCFEERENPLLNLELSLWMGGSLVDSSAEGVSSSLCLCHSTSEKAGFEHSSCASSGDGNCEAGIDFGQDDLVVNEIGMAIAEVMHVCSDHDDDEGTDSGEDFDENEGPLSLESDSTDDVVDIDNELVISPTFSSCNASESSINKSDSGNSSINGTPPLVSAMKGSRAKLGIATSLSVSWAPDVYDPPVTSGSHTVKGHQRISRKSHYKYKPAKSSSSRSSSGSKKDRKHSRHSSSSSSSSHKRDKKPSYRNTVGGVSVGGASSSRNTDASAVQYRDLYSSSGGSRIDIAVPQYSKLSPLVPSESATYRNVYNSTSGSRTDPTVPQCSKLSPLVTSESASLAGTVAVLKTLEPIKRSSSCCKEQPLSFLSRQFVAAKYKGMFSLWSHNQLAS
uniref:F-box domain-containing protein n=1 Tax=Oryza meridionalis TaxID=40149 RepID=A0A0E0C9F9_9ORYZ